MLEVQYNLKKSVGTDIIANAKERYTDYQNRVSAGGLLGITTGIPELDNATCGMATRGLHSIILELMKVSHG